MPHLIKVYRLRCPITNGIKYIGVTKQSLHNRLNGHMGGLQNAKNIEKAEWILSLRSKGLSPIIELIEELYFVEAYKREKYWISYYTNEGHQILNGYPEQRNGVYIKISPNVINMLKQKYGRAWNQRVEELIKQELLSSNLNRPAWTSGAS